MYLSDPPKLIVALDVDQEDTAWALVDKLDPRTCALKVGSELFTRLGPTFVRALVARQFNVFLDLKFHDIPNTVARSCIACAQLGVWMINVHALGGPKMMRAAREALDSQLNHRPLLIAVTVLTSMDESELSIIGFPSLEDKVLHLAKQTQAAGLDGVVSSALEVSKIKSACGPEFIIVTPGIRLVNSPADDQTRITTPARALKAGSDYLVVGRPITQSENPRQVIQSLNGEPLI